ncbi:hypothetical protein BKA10_001955 [Microbacterium invictum]|uniref:Uncharacterized protein n=1 Tax=Microbacterium invictum TaxID=515415 RepID=A0AA40VM85_9MICO|nr:hypothetical protein [Microbacterium invictum]
MQASFGISRGASRYSSSRPEIASSGATQP